MFYSKSTGGFYNAEFNGDNIPTDAVEITHEQHQTLIEGQSAGKVIEADKKGNPVLSDPPQLAEDQIQAQENATALAYLASTDWYVVRKLETGVAIPADIATARQAARDAIK